MFRYVRPAFFAAAAFAFVMATLPHPPELIGHPSDKIQHLLAFATLGILAAYGFAQRSILTLFAGLSIYGAGIEIVQAIPALHRDSDIVDLLVDMVAAGVTLCLARRIIALRQEH